MGAAGLKRGLWSGATRGDVLLALLVTAGIETLGLVGLGMRETEGPHGSDPGLGWAVPVQLETALPIPPPEPEPTAPAQPSTWIRNPKIKLGGGVPGGSVAKGPAAQPEMPNTEPPVFIPAPPSRPPVIVAPPGPTTSAPLPNLEPPPKLDLDKPRESIDYVPEPAERVTHAPPGEGFPDGVPEGTISDPLQAHAIRLYRFRLQAWFAARFKLTGTGLPQATLRAMRASASIAVSKERRVLGFRAESSGNSAFDAAVSRALESVRGLELPPPPQNYPGYIQGKINVVFVCGEDKCD